MYVIALRDTYVENAGRRYMYRHTVIRRIRITYIHVYSYMLGKIGK